MQPYWISQLFSVEKHDWCGPVAVSEHTHTHTHTHTHANTHKTHARYLHHYVHPHASQFKLHSRQQGIPLHTTLDKENRILNPQIIHLAQEKAHLAHVNVSFGSTIINDHKHVLSVCPLFIYCSLIFVSLKYNENVKITLLYIKLRNSLKYSQIVCTEAGSKANIFFIFVIFAFSHNTELSPPL